MNYPVKITISDLAPYIHMSAPLIRKLMREKILPIGTCFKHGDKWYYSIIEKDLRDYYGDKLVDFIIREKIVLKEKAGRKCPTKN